MNKIKIKKITDNNVEYFDSLEDAAASVQTNLEAWKVQMLNKYAMIKKGSACKKKKKKEFNYK